MSPRSERAAGQHHDLGLGRHGGLGHDHGRDVADHGPHPSQDGCVRGLDPRTHSQVHPVALQSEPTIRRERTDNGAVLDGTPPDGSVHRRVDAHLDIAQLPGCRILDGRFMTVCHTAGVPRGRGTDGEAYLNAFVEAVKGEGLVQQWINKSGVDGLSAAPLVKP